ncbi:MAG: DUF937 domain-containing protein [Burkholderiaceae bacterium]|nr:DUF937 domain-containing protein [Burkholderiaceae bacterium]
MSTSPTLVDELLTHLQGAPLQQLAQQLGMDTAQTQNAIGAALPTLLGALGQNAAPPQGAADVLGGLLGGAGGGAGVDMGAILGQMLGGNQQHTEAGVGQALGGNAGQLLQLLAPMVMAFLAQRGAGVGADAGAHSPAPELGGLGGGLLGKMLDQDGDGQVGLSDLLKIGGNLLGGRR